VRALSDRYDYVFTTGGIGPTHDDITAESIAKAFGRRLLRDPRAVALLARHYADPALLTEARLRMANIPEGAELIANPVSAAPGFHLENVFVFAGVPAIARAMFDNVRPLLRGGGALYSRTISAFVYESTIADDMRALAERHASLDIGSYPYFRMGKWGTALVVRGTDRSLIDQVTDALGEVIRRHGVEPMEGEGAE
jgi:molybdopterin-biosynthesis enzyme MoeA-like protein